MSVILAETEHWRIQRCPDGDDRVHIYCKHRAEPFPECWKVDALYAFADCIAEFFLMQFEEKSA